MVLSHYTWEQQLRDIKTQIAEVFGREILLTERAKQALLASPSLGDMLYDNDVLCELLCVSPSCALALNEIGWDYDWISDFRPERPQPARPMPYLARRLFQGMETSATILTPTAELAKKRGVLTDTDILLSVTETTFKQYGKQEPECFGTLAAHFIEDGWYSTSDDLTQIDEFLSAPDALALLRKKLSDVEWLDPAHSNQQFAIFLDEAGFLRVRPFAAYGAAKLELHDLNQSLVVCRGGIIQPVPASGPSISAEALELLEDMMNTASATESDYQQFFEEHPDILAGLDYGGVHPHLVLHRDEGGPLIPDFFLERLSSDFADLLELKLPYDTLVRRLRGGNRAWFRASVDEAKAQLLEYRDWFDERANREDFYRRYNLRAFRPRMVMVIGRRHHFRDEVERARLGDQLPKDLTIWTYDDLVDRARRYREMLVRRG